MRRISEAQVPDGSSDNLREEILNTALMTNNGQRLSPKEDRFISLYIKYADPMQAAKEAGYAVRPEIKNKDAKYLRIGKELLTKDYIRDEISYRSEVVRNSQIADAQEVLAYLTRVMRGEEKDQFNLDVSIADRTNAAKELNRRLRELEETAESGNSKEIRLVLRRE